MSISLYHDEKDCQYPNRTKRAMTFGAFSSGWMKVSMVSVSCGACERLSCDRQERIQGLLPQRLPEHLQSLHASNRSTTADTPATRGSAHPRRFERRVIQYQHCRRHVDGLTQRPASLSRCAQVMPSGYVAMHECRVHLKPSSPAFISALVRSTLSIVVPLIFFLRPHIIAGKIFRACH